MTTFDILLPYYGDPVLMRGAVESVMAQTATDWHLFVLDDAYPDEQIADWLRELRDDRVEFERATHNRGVNKSFQDLLRRSSADFVTFLGCDDVLMPRYITRLRDLVEAFPAAAVIQPGVRVIDRTGERSTGAADRVKSWLRASFPRGPALLGGQRLAASLLTGNWTYFPSLAWKRSWISQSGFRDGYEVVLDLDMLFDVICRGGPMLIDPEIVFEYRRHPASVSSAWAADGRRFMEEADFFHRASETARALGWHRADLAAKAHLTSRLHAVLTRIQAAWR